MYSRLDNAIKEHNFDPFVVVRVKHHVMTQCIETKKFCIFHYKKGKISELKWYKNIDEACDIMRRFLEEMKG